MCLAAIGTQTGGSIIRPAAFCGVAGFKPSLRHVSVEGIFPFAPTLDHPGPFVRDLRDLGLIFDAIERVPHSRSPDEETEPRGKPLLIRPRGFYDRRTDPVMLDAFEMALQLLAETGYEVVDLDDDRLDFEGVIRNHRTVMAAEAAATHESIFAEHRDSYAPHIRALVDEGLSTPVTRYVRALQEWEQYYRTFSEPLEGRGSQAVFVTPAATGPAPDTSTTGNPSLNSPWSYLGFPAVTFPIVLAPDGLPMGLQLVGPILGDRDLLRTALACETEIRRASQSGSP
jgi:aspartyl-tRNA(Asn)/glutamyl-tRNA(Gln) amidotransferase subunit A